MKPRPKSAHPLRLRVFIPASCFLLLSFCFLLPASFSNAQGIPASADGLNLRLSTNNPVPGQTVTVTAESFTADLKSSSIEWFLNGSSYQKGLGITSIEVKAPDLGKKLLIEIVAGVPSGGILRGSLSLGSGSIDIIVESDGYSPPFFKGKAPLSFQNTYKIVAVPHLVSSNGQEYDPRTLVYEWGKDSKAVPAQSGYGRQVFRWKEEIVPRERVISVKVRSRDGQAQAERLVIINASNPSVVFYVDDPLYGPLYNRAVSGVVGLGKNREVSVLATPFGFTMPQTGVGSLSFSWLVNSVEQSALAKSRSIVLRAPAETSGSSKINLRIRNEEDILQGARGEFAATFSAREDGDGDVGAFGNSNAF